MNDSGDVNLANHRQHQLHYLIPPNLDTSTTWSAQPSKLTISISIDISIIQAASKELSISINESMKRVNSKELIFMIGFVSLTVVQ